MSKRLQVLLDEEELEEIRRSARRERMSVAEWVRRSLRRARMQEPTASVETKLSALRQAVSHSYPTADIDEMLAEIERGYGAGPGR